MQKYRVQNTSHYTRNAGNKTHANKTIPQVPWYYYVYAQLSLCWTHLKVEAVKGRRRDHRSHLRAVGLMQVSWPGTRLLLDKCSTDY